MAWRKCLVRGLVLMVVAGLAAAGWLYHTWTHPEAIRQKIVTEIESYFVGSRARLEGATLSLWEGIHLHQLTLTRRDDHNHTEVLYIPSAVIYHDKEQLLQGELAVRKVVLQRPRLHVIREADGTWNIDGMLGEVSPGQPIPTVVIQDGTMLLEDRLAVPGHAPVEIKGVHFTLINDPIPVLTFDLDGATKLVGRLKLHGSYQRVTGDVVVSGTVPEVPVGKALLLRLGKYCDQIEQHVQQLRGKAHFEFQMSYQPGQQKPWSHTARTILTKGSLSHPQIPYRLEELEATLECSEDRLVLTEVTARSGATEFVLNGWIQDPHCAADVGGKLKVRHLNLAPELFAKLPESLQQLQTYFDPKGLAHLQVEFERRDGQWYHHSIGKLVDVSASFIKFPFRVHHLQGTVEQWVNPDEKQYLRRLDLVAQANHRPVHVQGDVTGNGDYLGFHVDLWGEGIPLTDGLISALSPQMQELARSFHPSGKGDFVAQIRRREGEPNLSNRFLIHFRDCTVQYDVFPYPLKKVHGTLDVLPDHWEFRDFEGTHKGGTVRISGRSDPTLKGYHISIMLQAENLLLDHDLEAALAPHMKSLQEAWRIFAPSGRMNVAAKVERPTHESTDVAVAVTVQGCAVRPAFLPYTLSDVSGTIRYANGRVDFEKMAGRHGATEVLIDRGHVLLKENGGFWAKVNKLRANQLIPDGEFLEAVPLPLQNLCRTLELEAPLDIAAEVIVDSNAVPGEMPVIYWDGGIGMSDGRFRAGVPVHHVDGEIWSRGRFNGRELEGFVGNLSIDEGKVFNQPIRNLHCHLEISKEEPGVLRIPDLKAKLFGGDVGGQARIEFGPTLHYDINLTAMQVKLEEFGRHNFGPKIEYSGQATARLFLTGKGESLDGLDGHGSFEVPDGKLYNLPVLLDLLKVLGLRPPDRTAFEEAYAKFAIRGPRVEISQLDLYGNAISLSGKGDMNLDGSDLQLDFYAVWGRIMQMLPSVLRPLPSAISQQLLRIKMRGRVDDVKATKEPVPILVDSLQKFLKRTARRTKEWQANRQGP